MADALTPEQALECGLKVGDRVRRFENKNKLRGTVLGITCESFIFSMGETYRRQQPLMISVLWDNGTRSVFTPKGLELLPQNLE